jgi:PPOX class probable F420-dependent enzyme
MADLADFRRIASADAFLCIVATSRADGSVQASLVNAGVMDDPVGAGAGAGAGDAEVVALVAAGRARKLTHLRARPRATVVARAGWEWAAVEGTVSLIGPDDPMPGIDAERLRVLLREVFVAAGGTHDDWDGYDAAMARERRVVVLVRPTRVYSNG